MKGMQIVLLAAVAAVSVIAAAVILPSVSRAGDDDATPTVRLGTYDSRAVAIAYARSASFRERIVTMKAELGQAQEAGDKDRAAELETAGQTMQELLHKQGFSTWPVDDILATIADEIPQIAQKAGVDVIVSRWDIVHQVPGVELIDVTDLMVKPFAPDEATLKTIEEMKQVEPVALEELEGHH